MEESADMFEIAPDILILILMFEYWIGLQFGMRPPQRKTKDVNWILNDNWNIKLNIEYEIEH